MSADTLFSVATFLVLSAGLGSAVLLLAKRRDWAESLLLSIGIGLGTLPLLILLFRILHVPLDIRVFLTLAAVGPAICVFRKNRWATPTLQRGAILGGALLIALLLAWIMYVGATRYPYLEDDDPWGHATAAHYVALEKTTAPPDGWITHYLEPYPPYYTAIMGMLHQLNPDTNHVLKAINALMVGLSLLAAFFAFDTLTGNTYKALAAAAVLAMIPAYMSHFIWSQTLAIPVFFLALWALEEARKSRHGATWRDSTWYLAVLMVWSATIIQPSTAAVVALLLTIYVALHLALDRRRKAHEYRELSALVAGGALSFLTWSGFVLRYGWIQFSGQIGISAGILASATGDTSGGLVYGLGDIVFAALPSKIDQATGLGWLVSLLALIGLMVILLNWTRSQHPPHRWGLVTVLWAIVGIIGIEGNALPVKLFPHRFWVFLAIPIALLAVEAAFAIGKTTRHRLAFVLVTTLIVMLAVWLNVGPRLATQQGYWPPGVFWNGQADLSGYSALPSIIPVGSRVLVLCSAADKAIGMGMDARPWYPGEIEFKQRVASATGDDVANFMEGHGYDYLTVDPGCLKRMGAVATQALLESVGNSGTFQLGLQLPQSPPQQPEGFFLLFRRVR